MTIKRKNRTLRHLVVFALERYFLETTKNPQGLKGFRAQLFRMKLSLDYDRKLDRKAGADAAYFRSVSQAWGMIKDMTAKMAWGAKRRILRMCWRDF